jgi:tetratricopeptide (TPR) repeat protein
MLTGKLPFESRQGSFEQVASQLIDDRTQASASPRGVNSSVSPGIDAIVRRCLAIDSPKRYQDAADVAEDLRLEVADKPLKHVREPWSAARFGKWRRRNKTQLTQMGLAAACLSAMLAGAIFWNRSQLLDANTALYRFDQQALEARTLLCIPDADPDLLQRGRELAASALAEFDGRAGARLTRLDPADSGRVRDTVTELHSMIDNAISRNAKTADKQNSTIAFATPEPATLTSARLMSLHKFGEAQEVLAKAVTRRGGDPVLWIQLGVAQLGTGDAASAQESFTAAVALQPESAVAWRYRGYARLDASQAEAALGDFDRAARLAPPSPSLELNRAIAFLELKRFREAERAASMALQLGADWPRAWLVRARIRERQGDQAGAEEDRRIAEQQQPVDADDWAALAVSCEKDEPERAIGYIEQGLSRYPNSIVLLRNHIHLLGDVLKRPQQALASAERILQIRPGDVRAQLSRAVILARDGESTRAMESCRQLEGDQLRPIDRLQLACVYALCVKEDDTAPENSLRELRLALGEEPSLAIRAAHDPDLSSLKENPQFRRLIGGAAALLQPLPLSRTSQSD